MKFKYSDYYRKLGLNIAYYRKDSGYTQEEIAEKIGIERAHFQRIETAKGAPSLDVLFAIAEALGTPLNKLFEFRD